MNEYLSQYLVSEEELEQLQQTLADTIDKDLKSDNRLRAFFLLYQLAKTSMDAIEKLDKKGFIQHLLDEVEKEKGRLNQILAERADEVQKQYNKLVDEVESIRQELHQRGKCIDDILEGLGEKGDTEAIKQQKEAIKLKMDEMEGLIQEIVNTRQKDSFAEIIRLAANKEKGH